MQVEFNSLNAVTKEINITLPAERAEAAYQKYLRKAARDISLPGFRKGKAPLQMVERMHTDTLKEYFYKDIVDEVFEEIAREHNIEFLLFPEVKDIAWEKGQEMTIKIEIEHEPTLEFKQLEGLTIPRKPQLLEEEVDKYIEQIRQENGKMIDIEIAEAGDLAELEISFKHGSESFTRTGSIFVGEDLHNRSLAELLGTKTGDKIETKLNGQAIMLAVRDAKLPLENDFMYPCQLMVNSITRMDYPALDDEFAKDMEFDTLQQMKDKIAEDLRLKNEHTNINIDNYSIITKLFVDNNFELPHKTIEYLAEKEAEKVSDPTYKKYYIYQYRMQIAKEMVSMYIMKNLIKAIPIEVTDEMLEEYIVHEAILEDKSAEAFKDVYKDEIGTDDFKQAALHYFTLRQIAANSEFVLAEAPAEEEIAEAETEEITEDI